ncbi:MAG: hypothetical protein HQ518_21015 [Rhodopirellula sp.]|nr:hypothetical protein [Rhodopirellula sp.]
MSDTEIDLSPGPITDSYNIPSTDWEIANKRVSIILDPSRGPAALQKKLKALPNYQQLVAVSQAWKASTFDNLVNFASNLGEFSGTTVQSYLTVLGMIVDQLVNGEKSMKDRFDNTVDGFAQATADFSSQASTLAAPLKKFDIQMTQSDVSGDGVDDPIWNTFSLNAGMAFDVLEGRFQTMTSDLTGMQTDVDQKLKKDDPIVVQLVDLPVAKQRWQSISGLASGFVANAPAQRKYLNGDW